MSAMLAVEGIDAFYGETQALFGVSLVVGSGSATHPPATATVDVFDARFNVTAPITSVASRFDG